MLFYLQVEHGPFVEFVQKYFVDMKPTWHSEGITSNEVDNSISQYTGGMQQVNSYFCNYNTDLSTNSHNNLYASVIISG